MLEFDSIRKRMSVIVKDISGPRPGEIKLICKGADNKVLENLDHTDPRNIERIAPTQRYVEQFA